MTSSVTDMKLQTNSSECSRGLCWASLEHQQDSQAAGTVFPPRGGGLRLAGQIAARFVPLV